MLSLLLKPSNIAIMLLSVMLAMTWAGYQTKKVQLAECRGELSVCQRDVDGYKAEMSSANSIIESLKANLASVKRQLGEWKQIAADADAFAQRLLAAAEAKVECEVYHAENARLTDEFVDSFNSRVRGKVSKPASAGDREAGKVVPSSSSANAPTRDR